MGIQQKKTNLFQSQRNSAQEIMSTLAKPLKSFKRLIGLNTEEKKSLNLWMFILNVKPAFLPPLLSGSP